MWQKHVTRLAHVSLIILFALAPPAWFRDSGQRVTPSAKPESRLKRSGIVVRVDPKIVATSRTSIDDELADYKHAVTTASLNTSNLIEPLKP